MLAIRGIYNGKLIMPLEKIPKNKKYKVIITFIEEINDADDDETRDFSAQTNSFSFWENPKEDIYEDYLTKK